TGRRALNLACVGGTSPLTYFLLKRSLDAGARPSALLVDFKATQLQSNHRVVERALAELLSPSESLELAWTARDPLMFARLAVSGLLPSVRARSEIREWVLAAVAGGSASPRRENLAALRNWTVNRGAGLLDKWAGSETIGEHFDEKCMAAPGAWYCHPLNAVYLRRFLVLAATRDIPVYWLLPPIHPRVQGRRDSLRLDANFDRMLRRATQRYANLTVIDGRGAGYPARHFIDSVHLDSEGAYAYSDDLASLLPLAPGGPRWVMLPAYRDRPITIPLEDQTGSRLALFGGPKSPEPGIASRAAGDRPRR
ncbi:MAG: hypothetical protein LC745_00685, partial [Planctomycetia bacterium]|nr:hypothetical protein [Planctomycetia bacterium]